MRAFPIGQLEDDYDQANRHFKAAPIGLPDQDQTAVATMEPPKAGPVPIAGPTAATPGPAPIVAPAKAPIGDAKLEADKTELSRLQNSGSGLDQLGQKPGLGHKIASVLGRIGDIAGSAFMPFQMEMIPGTTLHHNSLVRQAAGRVANDIDTETSEADLKNKLNPPDKSSQEGKTVETGDGVYQWNPDTQRYDIKIGPGKSAHKDVASPQAGYAAAIADALQRGADPNTDPHVMAWKSAIDDMQKTTEPKADDKARAIYAKDPKEWTPEEKSFIKGYEKQIDVSKTQPGVARINVLGGFGMEVADPDHPGQTIIVPRNQASGMAGKGSASVTVPKKEAEYMTSGKGGQQLTAFNTAISHLDTLERLSNDLHNSDIQVFNRASQEWAKATGQAAPANFHAAVNAMSGEVAAALKASGATDQEIDHVTQTFSNAQSPKQLKGAINTYRELLRGKRDNLKSQHEAAQNGQPNFGAEFIYARDPQGQLHKAPKGTALPQGWKEEKAQ